MHSRRCGTLSVESSQAAEGGRGRYEERGGSTAFPGCAPVASPLMEDGLDQGATPTDPGLARLGRLFASMPSMPRRVFVLHRFDGLSLGAIAIELGLDVRSVERSLAEAMFHLDDGAT